ncbi:MAG: type II toxin-antitoxin system VapB family antitoxin [Acidobacteriota bacterium]|nr:type II toxin-antitoxin system VapB family antitoxin [Acidobacteriota bacterium]
MTSLRMSIVLDEELLQQAKKYSSASTKRGLVEEALRTFVEVKSSEHRREEYAERLADIHKRTSNVRLQKSSSAILRENRNRR